MKDIYYHPKGTSCLQFFYLKFCKIHHKTAFALLTGCVKTLQDVQHSMIQVYVKLCFRSLSFVYCLKIDLCQIAPLFVGEKFVCIKFNLKLLSGWFLTRNFKCLMVALLSTGSSTDQDSMAYRFGDTDSGLGRATPPRRAPSPGMGLRHLPSPSGPGSLPGLMSKGRRMFDDGSSDISSTPSSMMDYNGKFCTNH